MTNAEKYLKDGVSIEELIFDIINFEKCWNRKDFDKEVKRIKKFFFTSLTPTLTEDERVILRNLRYEKGAYEYTKIGRIELDSEGNCDLILIDSDNESVWWGEYGHLFQFIKERRSI